MTQLPRVTHILEACGLGPDLSMVAPEVLEVARVRGSAVHAAIEGLVYGYLDEATVHPDTAPYVSAFRKFLADSKFEPTGAEIEVVHPAWRFRGHVDVVGWLSGRRALLDWKTAGAVDLVASGLQLAGYRLAYCAMHPAEPIDFTAVVQLKGDGTFRYHDIPAAQYEQTFLAAVLVYRAQKERGR